MSQTCVMDHPPDVIGAIWDFNCPQDLVWAVKDPGTRFIYSKHGCCDESRPGGDGDFDFPMENVAFWCFSLSWGWIFHFFHDF